MQLASRATNIKIANEFSSEDNSNEVHRGVSEK